VKVRLGQISYVNVLPVYWGFRERNLSAFLDITTAPPRILNRMLRNTMIDISPVSSISYVQNCNDWLIIPGLSIASRAAVMSVLLLHRIPFGRLSRKRIMVSDESETSVELLRLCLRREHVFPLIEQGTIRRSMLDDPDISALLVIGDLALELAGEIPANQKTDLGSYWREWTGKPFVFALWAVRKEFARKEPSLVRDAVAALKASLEKGLRSLSVISAHASEKLGMDTDVMEAYFKGLSYELDQEHEEGLRLFFDLSRERGSLKDPVPLEYFTS